MEFIKYEVEGAVATITIDRQKALNALNSQVPTPPTFIQSSIFTIVEQPMPPPMQSVARPVFAPFACIS